MYQLEVIGNRVYLNGILTCYAAHQIPNHISGHCYISYSHRHKRDLINISGKYWMGSNDYTLPLPDIIVGTVVSTDGLLPDPETMVKLVEYIQDKEDEGIPVTIEVS